MKKYTCLAILFIFFPMFLYSVDKSVIDKSAVQICKISSNKNKSRLAIFVFTDAQDKESADSKKVTTIIIGRVLNCTNIKVIDQSKVKQLLEEQSKGMTGIIDEETAPATGKLIGADALVFGQVDKKSIQIRLIDAETGEILGSTIEEGSSSEKVIVKEEKFDTEKLKKKFRLKQVRRKLRQLARNKPIVFILVTSTKAEIENYSTMLPDRFVKIVNKIDNDNSNRKKRFVKMRELVLETRQMNRNLNRRILKTHERLIRRINRNRGRRGRGRDGRRRRRPF